MDSPWPALRTTKPSIHQHFWVYLGLTSRSRLYPWLSDIFAGHLLFVCPCGFRGSDFVDAKLHHHKFIIFWLVATNIFHEFLPGTSDADKFMHLICSGSSPLPPLRLGYISSLTTSSPARFTYLGVDSARQECVRSIGAGRFRWPRVLH